MNKVPEEYEEKRDFFTIVSYGLHSKYQKEFRALIEQEIETKSIFIYEYFLDSPFVYKEKKRKISGFLPFILRILNEQKFVPILDKKSFPKNWKDVNFIHSNFINLWNFWNFEYKGARADSIFETNVGKEVFYCWNNRKSTYKKNEWIEYDEEKGIVIGNFDFDIDYLRDKYLQDINKFSRTSYIGALKEYLTVVYPWLLCSDLKKMRIGTLSVSTENIFYGYIFIFYPFISEKNEIFKNIKGKETLVSKKIRKWIHDTYAPSLQLFESCWAESLLYEELSSNVNPDWNKYIFLNDILKNSNSTFERALYYLWTARKNLFKSFKPKKEALEIVKKSIIFPKYLIGSIAMVNKMKTVILPREEPKEHKERKHLPSFLIVGFSGSGKDSMSKIIQLFFPEYRFGKRYIINMAALKPNFLSTPLLTGIEIKGEKKYNNDVSLNFEFRIRGIFSKIWKEHEEMYPESGKAKKLGLMPVVILDELNSLDIDAQGSLLRILENAEFQPLGSPGGTNNKMDLLIIATANESEEVLTLEEPLREFISKESVFGGILGKLLYEKVRNIRRLREDLYYRIIRDGKIDIPNLDERKEDIPLFFSLFVKNEIESTIGNEIKWKDLWFDFSVFESFMKENISWSGNFRKLESVAKRVAINVIIDDNNREAVDKLRNDEKSTFPIHISISHVKYDIKKLLLN